VESTVLAVPSSPVKAEFGPASFVQVSGDEIIGRLTKIGAWFGPRRHLESDFSFRQIIPYVIIRRGPSILTYRRSAHGSEVRLRDRLSIGVGGHVEVADAAVRNGSLCLETTLLNAARREILEEVGIQSSDASELRWLGVLLDDTTDVSRVHLGIVGVLEIGSIAVDLADPAITEVGDCTLDILRSQFTQLETWSRLALVLVSGESS
jgi:predicted NUDIX family phosphoesterase